MSTAIIRFVVSASVLWVTALLLPGVSSSLVGVFLAAGTIAVIGWLGENFLGNQVSRHSRGFVGFIIKAGVIWLTGQIVPERACTQSVQLHQGCWV
ncbi:MAG: hypothetical protein DDT34_00988 [Firmicutes bacterium]|nr:hypothetical protein [Bacillota bacterium]